MKQMCPESGIACWEDGCMFWDKTYGGCLKVLVLKEQLAVLHLRK